MTNPHDIVRRSNGTFASGLRGVRFIGDPWTPAEMEALREAYPRGGIYAAILAVPNRSDKAIYRKVYNMGLGGRRRRWTDDDFARLKAQWGLEPIASIARSLGRTILTVYWQAQQLGLEVGCPEGWEYVSHAADRTGYPVKSLQMILRWARVKLALGYSRNKGKRRRHIVEPFDVDDAIARWHETETVTSASRRHDVLQSVMVRMCVAAGVQLTRTGTKKKSHMRAESVEFDRAVRLEAESLSKTEGVLAAAKRVGVTRQTMRDWLRRHGVERGRKFERFGRELIDKVVAAELGRPGCRVARTRAAAKRREAA